MAEKVILLSRIIKAAQIGQEEKLRKLFQEKKAEKDIELTIDKIPEEKPNQQKSKEDVEKDVQTILENARAEAAALIVEAESEVDKAREISYQEGLKMGKEEGAQAGFEQALNQFKEIMESLQREVERTQLVLNHQIESLSPRLIRLSTQIAEKIIHRELKLQPEIIIDQVENILKELSRVKSLAIRIPPSAIDLVKTYETHFLSLTQGIAEIDFVIDHSLQQGGCIIETNSGGVDASIQTQLEMITAALLDEAGDQDA